MDPRAVAYVRVSSEHQAETATSEQQVEALQVYARQRGWVLQPEQIYRDEGYSGARLDRPALDRLRDVVARGEVDTLLVTCPDRLARRYAYQVWLLEEFDRAGCQIVFLERPPSDDPQDTLVIQIRGAVAEYERTVIADRTRRGRLAALRAGRLLPWSIPPYGYQVDPRTPRNPAGPQIEESQAVVVRQIFAWYGEDGLSLYRIAMRLTEQGVPTPRGRPIWKASCIRTILGNHCYTGTAYGNKLQAIPARRHYPLIGREARGPGGVSSRLRPAQDWIAVPVPAIIARAVFDQAQARLVHNRQWALRNTRREYLVRCLDKLRALWTCKSRGEQRPP
jgi:site-specific DNA recombinase